MEIEGALQRAVSFGGSETDGPRGALHQKSWENRGLARKPTQNRAPTVRVPWMPAGKKQGRASNTASFGIVPVIPDFFRFGGSPGYLSRCSHI